MMLLIIQTSNFCNLMWLNELRSPFRVEVLGFPVGNRHQGFVWAGQWRWWGTHGGPALWVGCTVEPWRNGWAVPSPRRARGGSVTCRQRLWFWLLLHGLHLILLCTAPDVKDGRQREGECWSSFINPRNKQSLTSRVNSGSQIIIILFMQPIAEWQEASGRHR